jgi:TnsA endonuclease N terminal
MFFEKSDGKRKWQCFVCGKEHSDFETFSAHITETHEEGREYILCPLGRCGAPVRDIKTHFRAKHPNEEMPKFNGPNRTIVWKDFGNKKTKKSRKPAFREGHFVSLKNNGKEFFYRSSYECEVLECLEQLNEVLAYDVEPFKDGIPYMYQGEPHKYHPDFSIKFNDGHIEIWEIKPANQTQLPLNEAKWAAAKLFCDARGWKFIVYTEVGIGKLKKVVKRRKGQQ